MNQTENNLLQKSFPLSPIVGLDLYFDTMLCSLRDKTPQTINGVVVDWPLLRSLRLGRTWTEDAYKLVGSVMRSDIRSSTFMPFKIEGDMGYAACRYNFDKENIEPFYVFDGVVAEEVLGRTLQSLSPFFDHSWRLEPRRVS